MSPFSTIFNQNWFFCSYCINSLKVSGKLNMASLIAVSKLKFKLERQKKPLEIGFNPKVLIGLSRFKKKLGMKSSMESTPRDEEPDDDPNKMRFITAI